jgi:hypothetical protein
MKPTKQDRAKAIEVAACMIASEYGVNVRKLFLEAQTKCQQTREAKELLVYYLHSQGMSFLSISRIIGRSEDFTRRAQIAGQSKLMKSDKKLIARLPKIPS